MVLFVSSFYSPKYLYSIIRAWLANFYSLKPALKGRVSLYIFAIIIHCGRAYSLHFSSRKRWLEDICGIHGTFCRTRAYKHMQFIDEQHTIGCRLYLRYNLL